MGNNLKVMLFIKPTTATMVFYNAEKSSKSEKTCRYILTPSIIVRKIAVDIESLN